MVEPNLDILTGSISITALPQENGRYLCQISPSLSDQARPGQVFYGQTKDHAVAVALEHLADQFREAAEASQKQESVSSDVEAAEQPQERLYHVILHYEGTIKAESRFDALHDTRMGNTVVENAKSVAIEISPDAEQQVLQQEWRL